MQQEIHVTVDAVIFGYNPEAGVFVLLIKRKLAPYQDMWALPGGYILQNEPLEVAVTRELQEETGVQLNYLEQLATFGEPNRDPRNRTISIAYFGLVKSSLYELHASTDASDAAWFKVNGLPALAFDHADIIRVAITRLRNKITYEPIGFELLDEKFPFSEVEKLYSFLLGREIDRRNFKKKLMSYGILDELEEKVQRGAGRPGNLYSFNKEKYFQLKDKGLYFDLYL